MNHLVSGTTQARATGGILGKRRKRLSKKQTDFKSPGCPMQMLANDLFALKVRQQKKKEEEKEEPSSVFQRRRVSI